MGCCGCPSSVVYQRSSYLRLCWCCKLTRPFTSMTAKCAPVRFLVSLSRKGVLVVDISLLQTRQRRRRASLISEDRVACRSVLQHLVADLCEVVWFVGPIPRRVDSAFARQCIKRSKLERCEILKDKVSSAVIVDPQELSVDAFDEVGQCGPRCLTVSEECIYSQIVRADPVRREQRCAETDDRNTHHML